MAVFAYLYFNNVVAQQTVTVGYMLQKSLQLDGAHMLELFTKLGASKYCAKLFDRFAAASETQSRACSLSWGCEPPT